ncbi:WS/DGAT domain-containing protein [Rhodococcus ruber]|uniref:WS/DGAT domain-containing protein n=1 Tax=Rhodococcus ruber TaxID=1830 RepID=A0ABT4MG23_9NOCA|nr:wax ester/triacylglycerol synthase domain-containing protein [Rhodococcus ruber]MCZ4519939.1 WS/DGAT domain-containing protein [Rhodococcus ruber]
MSRLDMKDAVYHFGRDHGGSSDQFALLVFDSIDGSEPTFADVQAHVESRAPRVSGLGVRLQETLWGLDYPRWVRDDSPPRHHLVDHDLGQQNWDGVEHFIGELLCTRLDMRDLAWKLHVIRGVRDAPLVRGTATLVVLQVGHALTDGLGVTRLLRALFAPPSDDRTIDAPLPGHTEPDTPVRAMLGAARALLSAPVDLAISRLEAHRSLRAVLGTPMPPWVRASSLNRAASASRAVRIVPIPADEVRAGNSTVTVSALAAVGSSLNKYLRDVDGQDNGLDVAATVPVALPPDRSWPAANRVVIGMVNLHVATLDPDERRTRIARSLDDERARVTGDPVLRLARADEQVPAPIVRFVQNRRFRRRTREPVHVAGQTTVVSVNRGAANLELCGATARFTAGFPYLEDGRGLTHGFFGLGETVTVVAVACPDVMPSLTAYTHDLVDELRRRPTPG